MGELSEIEKTIGYTFKNKDYLVTAMTHSSYANESKTHSESNERLEFLGDSVLGIITSEYLFKSYSHLAEGELTKLRASLVCEKTLSEFAKTIDLGESLIMGRGEIHTGGKNRPSILADAFEALIAAIYLDGGFNEAKRFVLSHIVPAIDGHRRRSFRDYKTALQEIIQQNPEEKLDYVLVGESGPDHDKRFTVEVLLNSNIIGRGVGKTKKEAEQMSAKEALDLMGL
ncbi:MAG: ribonuclease III [Clostridia bacterium]|nr:ribonuclease III [Clostridia bacterium]